MSVLITTELIGEHPALSSIDTNFNLISAWIRNGDGFVGFGEYKKFIIRGEDRFDQARIWWCDQLANFKVNNNVYGSGTGPLLFTSFSFDSNAQSVLVIPEIVLGRKNGKSWITWIGDKKRPDIKKISESSISGKINWLNNDNDEENWHLMVTKAIEAIKNNQVEKIVLARDLTAVSTTTINPRNLLQRLEIDYPSIWLFFVDGLIGATPELLVKLNKSQVASRVLAGTIPKSGNKRKDSALAISLMKSSKDLKEHQYAVKSIADNLAPFCSSINVPKSPFILHLPNVMHLATDIRGVLNNKIKKKDIFTLLKHLHLSAATCGTPTNIAKKYISQLEKIDRDRYSGPVGWINAQCEGEIAIAIRCGLLSADRKSIRIFAGCGIVADSNPKKEFLESQSKFIPMRTALDTL
jgi:menaquinone-specific isochorismate synthase